MPGSGFFGMPISEAFFFASLNISPIGEWVLSSQTAFKDINNIGLFFFSHGVVQCSKQVSQLGTNDLTAKLEPPEHLDGIDNADISVGKVIKASQGESREHPHQPGMRDSENPKIQKSNLN